MKSKFYCVVILILLKYNNAILRDDDTSLDTLEIARRNGYQAESHSLITEDGYILEVHRIYSNYTKRRKKQPILFQHGLFGSSKNWVNVPNACLAFLLADAGYDVWLGNSRGISNSKSHVTYSFTSPMYWNFSFHEVGYYDLPATISFILDRNNASEKIFFVGYSRGCTSFLVYASMFPETAAKQVEAAFLLAPSAFIGYASGYFKYPIIFLAKNRWIFDTLGITHISLQKIGGFLVKPDEGYSSNEGNYGFIFGQLRENISIKEGVHQTQLMETDEFRMFDYGSTKNLKEYGSRNPPEYKLEKIQVPMYYIFGENDIFVRKQDANKLLSHLSNKYVKDVKMIDCDHLNIIFSEDSRKLIYKHMIEVFDGISWGNNQQT